MPVQKTPVFTYICSSIGETLDVYRFPTPNEDDLKDAVDNYNLWKSSEKDFIKKIISERTNGRFKAIGADEFTPEISWLIENWWTYDEKIKSGLLENKSKTVE